MSFLKNIVRLKLKEQSYINQNCMKKIRKIIKNFRNNKYRTIETT